MSGSIIPVVLLFVVACAPVQNVLEESDQRLTPDPKEAPFGTYFTPRNFPESFIQLTDNDVKEYFRLNAEIGSHVAIIHHWPDHFLELQTETILQQSHEHGFAFILTFDPLEGATRATPNIPESVTGDSFANKDVREAYTLKALELASWEPDLLLLGAEVNLLLHEGNHEEYGYFLSLVRETQQAIKEIYPEQDISISFQWDILRQEQNFEVLEDFAFLDVYSFTSYPSILQAETVEDLPRNYYADIRNHLPEERIVISEIAWHSSSSEREQAAFVKALPQLLGTVNPEYVSYFFLFDMPPSFLPDPIFRSLGLRQANGAAKPAWVVATNLSLQ